MSDIWNVIREIPGTAWDLVTGIWFAFWSVIDAAIRFIFWVKDLSLGQTIALIVAFCMVWPMFSSLGPPPKRDDE